MAAKNRIKKAWNAFKGHEQKRPTRNLNVGPSSSNRPDRPRMRYFNERSIISSIYTRISIDVAGIEFRHIKLDEKNRYLEDIDSPLNQALTLEPNLDQSPRAFRQDIIQTLFDKGVAAIVPVDTSDDPEENEKFDIHTLRVGDITAWHPKHVMVNLYNEELGRREEILLEKKHVAIIENPLYSVMNETNSTLQRLIRKLNLLDNVDDTTAGRLDLLIQLPYVIKSEARKQQAQKRREEIEFQLKQSQYGIAYTDGTERVTQLNRPAENQLLKQVEYLTELLYSQLGITAAVMDGTANEETMLNYFNRTIEPLLDAIKENMERSFLGAVGRKNKEEIRYFRDPFKLAPLGQISEIADAFTRNEILSSNEVRGFLGIAPSKDPKADELRNSNMPQPNQQMGGAALAAAEEESQPQGPSFEDMDSIMNEVFDSLDSDVDNILREVESSDA